MKLTRFVSAEDRTIGRLDYDDETFGRSSALGKITSRLSRVFQMARTRCAAMIPPSLAKTLGRFSECLVGLIFLFTLVIGAVMLWAAWLLDHLYLATCRVYQQAVKRLTNFTR